MDYPLLSAFWTMLLFFGFLLWLYVLFITGTGVTRSVRWPLAQFECAIGSVAAQLAWLREYTRDVPDRDGGVLVHGHPSEHAVVLAGGECDAER